MSLSASDIWCQIVNLRSQVRLLLLENAEAANELLLSGFYLHIYSYSLFSMEVSDTILLFRQVLLVGSVAY